MNPGHTHLISKLEECAFEATKFKLGIVRKPVCLRVYHNVFKHIVPSPLNLSQSRFLTNNGTQKGMKAAIVILATDFKILERIIDVRDIYKFK